MTQFKLIHDDTDIDSLEMNLMPWDVVVQGCEYQVVRIKGYVHTLGGEHGENDLWMYPRHEHPTSENLIEYGCKGHGVCWGITYKPQNRIRGKWDETEGYTTGGAMITRNGKDFFYCSSGIDEARYRLGLIGEHPLSLNEYGFAEKMIGRKVWYRSEPAIITYWVDHGQACVILIPDGIERFSIPPEFGEDYYIDKDRSIKVDIFDKHVWWFRD